ncbi:GNAT family N-acetyltransferase [Microvirga sp. GCM10011540]|uniref:GNAT family N-acetyltransferase n=1 Tax=Microvirga sp. GCM10011540 TaxID=3317338 RepID=UPI003609C6C3
MPLPAGVASHPALAFTTTTLAEIMTAYFEGYVIPQAISGEMFNARFRRESLDLRASRVLVESDRPVALIVVARRGWTARIAAMGIIPSHRARGLGRAALSEVINDLRRLGDRRLILEVIDTNEAAIRLYSSLGFETRRRLIGYRRPADVAAPPPVVTSSRSTRCRSPAGSPRKVRPIFRGSWLRKLWLRWRRRHVGCAWKRMPSPSWSLRRNPQALPCERWS